MRANVLSYTWKGVSGYSYGYVLITNSFCIEDIIVSEKPVILWGRGGVNHESKCVLENAGIKVYAFCDFLLEKDITTSYIKVKNYRKVIQNADAYFHIVSEIDYFRMKEIIKFLEYAKVEEFGILYSGYMKDFSERAILQNAVYDSIYEVFGNVDFLGHWNELENCRRAALEGTGYWDVPFMQIYAKFRKLKSTKYLEVGPGIGIMSLALKKIMDINITWLNIPDEESLWAEWRRESFGKYLKKYSLKIIEGFIELDDLSQYYNSFDVIVLAQVMEHFIYNPVNAITKLKNLLNDNGILFVSVPEEIRHYNVVHYSEMPYPDDLSQEEREVRCTINELWHFHEYSYDEAMEVFEESGLKCIQHIWTPPIHHFMLCKK